MKLTIRSKLTLVFAALSIAVISGAGIFLRSGLESRLDRTIDEELKSRAQTIIAGIANGQFGDEEKSFDPDASFAQVVNPDGTVTQATLGAGHRALLSHEQLTALGSRSRFYNKKRNTRDAGETPQEVRLLAIRSSEGPIVIVGSSLEAGNQAVDELSGLLWLGGAPALGLMTLIGWLLAGTALRPVDRMRREASAISEGGLHRRLDVPATGDEIAHLAETLNAMLVRIEGAFEKERRFVDDASHELRTPLGILKTELELALRRSRTKEELEAALRSAFEESDRLNRLAEDLLVLARADRGTLPMQRSRTSIPLLLNRVADGFSTRAKARNISIGTRVEGVNEADIDESRIRQAVANLVDNSLISASPGGTVTIEARADAGSLVLSVSDDGDGFPPGFAERAFEPFSRADKARSRQDGGVGLGLAIVRAVVEGHGGQVTALNVKPRGAMVRLTIPLGKPEKADS